MRKVLVAGVLLFSSHAGQAKTTIPTSLPAPKAPMTAPVVLLTIDGVRWQEIFHGTDSTWTERRLQAAEIVPNLYRLGMTRGAFIGAPGHGEIVASGPEHISLPGYNELMSGRVDHGCINNECKRTKARTLLDDAAANGAKVGAFSSWARIDLAVTSKPGSFRTSCGPKWAPSDADASRSDHETATEALAFLENEKPDVFYLGLGEPDEHAHHGNYEAYIDSLQKADAVLGKILEILDRDERGRHAHVIVTPDHGRSHNFRSHGGIAPEAARVWMVAGGPNVRARGFVTTTDKKRLADVAPTLRFMAGMTPSERAPIGELFTESAQTRR